MSKDTRGRICFSRKDPRFHSGLSLVRLNVPLPYAATPYIGSQHPLTNALHSALSCGGFQPLTTALYRTRSGLLVRSLRFLYTSILPHLFPERKKNSVCFYYMPFRFSWFFSCSDNKNSFPPNGSMRLSAKNSTVTLYRLASFNSV